MTRVCYLLFLVTALAACTVIGGKPVPGWPPLEIVEHHVPHHLMREKCARYSGPLMTPMACAEFNFARSRCDIWFSADFPPQRFLVEHEREHCMGYEHAGESDLRNLLARWNARQY